MTGRSTSSIITLWQQGQSLRAISRATGRDRNTIKKVIEKYKIDGSDVATDDEIALKLKEHTLSEADKEILFQMEKNKQLASKYIPSCYDGRVVLLKAYAYSSDKNYQEFIMDYDNGWNAVLKNTLEIYSIEGKHEHLLDADHLPIIAQRISNIIKAPIPAILRNPKLKTMDKHFLHAILQRDEYLTTKLLSLM